jgi:glycosyltransferase involved in cell wall biosynthesis
VKLLHLIHSLNPAGGGPMEAVRQVSLVHQQDGHSVEIACLDDPASPWLVGFPFTVHAMGPGRGSYGYSPRLAPWLADNHQRFDLVVVNGLWQFPGLAAHRVLAGGATPYVVIPHGMLDPWFKRAYPLKHLKKWLYWPWGEYRVLRDARLVLFTAQAERLGARQSFWLYRANERVVNLGTAAPPTDAADQRAAFLSAHPALARTRNLLFLGRIQVKKGCDLMIDAFAAQAQRDQRLRLVMAGPDQDGWQPRLAARARALGVGERVVWTGMLQGAAKWGAFRAAEAFVLPSHQENFGIAVAEALACRVPVLISDKINIWREIVDEHAGLVGSDDAAGTSAVLTRWLDLDDAQRSAMADAALACFNKRFHIRSSADSFLAAFAAAARAQTVTTP